MIGRAWTKSEILVNGGIRLSLYKSGRSKLQLAVGDIPGPMVNGCVSFVTETDCDDGLPHTLEHLVFMGSKKYPYKGVLDIIANRCLASGTNAWTDQDHTAYTLSTVGSAGFFKVLPVYVNHLLSPTLSDSQFATEVHHINGDGDDAGVVYSEMQDHESEMDNIMDRRMKEILYPPGNSYAVDSGGRLRNLRESCNIDKVRSFHKQFYHLSNMLVTVCGKVNHEELLDIMSAIEEEHLPNVPSTFPRPFSSKLESPSASTEVRVVCPSDDETRGTVDLTWFAPENYDSYMSCAFEVLFDYLTNTAVSPMQKDFILNEDPLASYAHFRMSEQSRSTIHLQFTGVPMEKLDRIKNRFLSKTVEEHLNVKAWDMERMGFLIEQTIQNELVKLERSGHDEVIGHMIGYQLFDCEDIAKLEERVDQVALLRRLLKEELTFWIQLLKQFNEPYVCVIGVPDKKMVDQIAEEEKVRVEAQKKTLGEDGLKSCAAKLAAAIHENTANKPSTALLDQLIVKDLERFDVFNVGLRTNCGDSQNSETENKFLKQFPFPAVLHNIESNFIEAFLLLDTSCLSLEQRTWLMLFDELMFDSPAFINGERHSADDVAKLYTKDLVDHSVEIGVGGHYDQLLDIRIKVVASSGMVNLAKWLDVFTSGIIFEADRVKMCAQKLASEAREQKRDGCTVAGMAISSMTYSQNSNTHIYDSIILEKVHEKIVNLCDENPEEVIHKLEKLRTAILKNGVNMHILCDVKQLDSTSFREDIWTFAKNKYGKTTTFMVKAGDSVDHSCIGRQKVVSVGGSESSFIYQSCLLDCDWQGEALLPTMLFTQYLSQCEGPLWRGIRGDGLAYGANIYVKPDRKMITLSLYRCAQPRQAYEQTKQIVIDLISSNKVDESEFEAAKRSLVYELMKREGTVSASGKLSVLGTLRKTNGNFNRTMCENIWNMTPEEMLKVGGTRVANLFENYVRAIAVHPQKVSEIKKAFPGITSTSVGSFYYDMGGDCKRQLRKMIRNLPCIGDGSKKKKSE